MFVKEKTIQDKKESAIYKSYIDWRKTTWQEFNSEEWECEIRKSIQENKIKKIWDWPIPCDVPSNFID